MPAAAARVRYSHAPEEARLACYEGLLALVDARARRSAGKARAQREARSTGERL